VLCDLLNMQGAIDGIHMLIFKPSILYPKDYYYHKYGGYSMVTQAMVDSNKIFMYIYISLLGNVNDSRVLKRFGLYQQVQYHVLFNASKGCKDGTPPYLLGNKGYLFIR